MPPYEVRLDRERICRAAVALADADRLATVTMRAVGAAVGVEAMSLYHHVKGRDDLLDGMVDLVYSEVHAPGRGADWRDELRRRSTSLREALVRHRWAVGLLDGSTTPGPVALRHHDALIRCLSGAGFAHAEVGTAMALLDSHVLGFVLQEVALPQAVAGGDGADALAAEMFPPEVASSLPDLVRFATAYASHSGRGFADEFPRTLDLILDSLDRLPRATSQEQT